MYPCLGLASELQKCCQHMFARGCENAGDGNRQVLQASDLILLFVTKARGGRADMILLPETHGRVEREVKGDSFSRSIAFLGKSDSSSGN